MAPTLGPPRLGARSNREVPAQPRRLCEPYGVQDRSVPAISMETTDSSPGQRICDEPDGAPAPLALAPAEVPLPAAAPVVLAVPIEGMLGDELALLPA